MRPKDVSLRAQAEPRRKPMVRSLRLDLFGILLSRRRKSAVMKKRMVGISL